MFAIYPLKARALVDTPNGVQLFAQYAAKVAERYPYVRKIICLNEGNQPRFHQPQFDDAGNGISGFVQEQAMAACYDALKAVDPGITVIAFGLSPRGNDDFDAPSNVSHSPIRFLKEVGDAYRQSGRTKPIADDLSVHCYPNAEHRRAVGRLSVAEGRLRQLRPLEAGVVGRVPRHRAAALPRGRADTARPVRAHLRRRGRLPGEDLAPDKAGAVQRRGERAGDRRGDAGLSTTPS